MRWLLEKVASFAKRHWLEFLELMTCSWGLAHWADSESSAMRGSENAADVAHQQAERMAIEQGAVAAHLRVQQTYAEEMRQLDKEQQQRAAALAHNPAELARYIVDVTRTDKLPNDPPA